MKRFINDINFMFYFVMSRVIRLLLAILDKKGPLDAAMISNYRDLVDVRRLGYYNVESLPDVLSWTRYVWEDKYKARLFMIGSITENIGGDLATPESIARASEQFKKAVAQAISLGARTILYAAATKRLPIWEELKQQYPNVVFTLGDNFTGLLLGERILDAFRRSKLIPQRTRVLVIAPYGLLGSVALHYALNAGAEVVCMGNPKRINLLRNLQTRHGIDICTTFESVGKVDMVVACNSAQRSQLTPERVDMLRKEGKKLIVIDPNEPANMRPRLYRQTADRVIRLDSGNGHSSRLKHILDPLMPWILRLETGVTWGCFSETLIICANQELSKYDWFEISPRNIAIVTGYLGEEAGQFALPTPTCFNKPVADFDLTMKTAKTVPHDLMTAALAEEE